MCYRRDVGDAGPKLQSRGGGNPGGDEPIRERDPEAQLSLQLPRKFQAGLGGNIAVVIILVSRLYLSVCLHCLGLERPHLWEVREMSERRATISASPCFILQRSRETRSCCSCRHSDEMRLRMLTWYVVAQSFIRVVPHLEELHCNIQSWTLTIQSNAGAKWETQLMSRWYIF